MKLLSVKLFNFRQFWGEVALDLAHQGDRTTTIIHGNNGAGKTTLLNAFTWVLYESFSAAFAAGPLVNNRALAEAPAGSRVECWVEVLFEHNRKEYLVRRSRYVDKSQEAGANPEETSGALQLKINGELVRDEEQVEEMIGNVLPSTLHRYFFFDGERIEQIVKSENREDMATAIKTLLSVEMLERGIRHLDYARKMLERELKEIGDTETKRLVSEKSALEEERARKTERREAIVQDLLDQEDLKQKYMAQLRDLASVKEIQQRRDDLQAQMEELEQQLNRSEDRLRRTISSRGYMVFLKDTIADFKELAADLRRKGELPAGIKRQFVQDLLDQQSCICGAELTTGTANRQAVESWLDKGGLQDVEEAVIKMGGEVESLERQIPEFWAEIDQEQASIENLRQKIGRLQDQLSGIREQLKDDADTNVQGIERRLEDTENKITDRHREDAVLKDEVSRLDAAIAGVDKKIKAHKARDQEQARVNRQREAALEAIARLEEVKHRVDVKFRGVLEAKVREIFRKISFTPYLPKLTEKYELMLIDPNLEGSGDALVGASTGQNQILSLAFIGSVIDRVRVWSQKHSAIGLDGGGFPIVMDSPFGSLDSVNRSNIAEAITELADQLVVMVSKTQWLNEVEREMEESAGAEYVLVYYTAKEDAQPDEMERYGRRYPLVKRSPNEFTWTEVIRVDRIEA
ncbi:AAA family ATPase [Leptolyngbya iicbica]|uniref:Nuclease SbcCD subunit C n=2 Tax=Cyanophyceae TaxID=3028117 RepID=A0A4Q7E8K5_9CYAN|nr:AAA family ATPase [Leptolyngbya sp. LK]RZM79147.1 ATP-binding protein [Leptolyngbya sp. LK]